MNWDFGSNTKFEKHAPKRSGVEKGAEGISAQERGRGEGLVDTAQKTLSGFEGPITESPYYKSLVATGTDATSRAYENAKAASAARAKAAGFGYGTPIGEATSRETEGAEARDLATVPTRAIEATAPLELEAAGQTGKLGLGEEGLGAEYFTKGVVPLEEQYMQRKKEFTDRLWDMGLAGVEAGAKV